jgi:hypothetical protein
MFRQIVKLLEGFMVVAQEVYRVENHYMLQIIAIN